MLMMVVIILVALEMICTALMIAHWFKARSFSREATGLERRLNDLPTSRAAVAVSNRLWVTMYNRNMHVKYIFLYSGMLMAIGTVLFVISMTIM